MKEMIVFDVILLLALFVYLKRAWRHGFVWQLVDLVSWVVAALIAWFLSSWIKYQLPLVQVKGSGVELIDAFLSSQISGIVWFLLILLVLRILTWLLHPFTAAVNKVPLVGLLNHALGLALGIVKTLLIGYLIVLVCHLPGFAQGRAALEHSVLRYYDPICRTILAGSGELLDRLNVFDQLQKQEVISAEDYARLEQWLQENGGEGEAFQNWLDSLQIR